MAFTYLVVDSFSIVFLVILYSSMREHSVGLEENRRFCLIVLMTIAALLCDMLAWQLDGVIGPASRVTLWVFNILCYVLAGVIALNWYFYVGVKLNLSGRIVLPVKILISLPCIFLGVVAVLSPWTHWMFSLDAKNVYQRGGLFFIQTVIPFGYLFAAAFRAGLQARRERLRQQRKECLLLASFIVFPLIGGLLQILVYGLSLAWPCTALSLMLVYVNLQNQMISLDALTGLNNRGQFDKYLYNCVERINDEMLFALYMLDIDGFKKINDKLGHMAGDAALISAANILRRAIADSNAFLARYGGDEFAIVLHYGSQDMVPELLHRIEAESDRFNTQKNAPPYRIVFSIGYVCSNKKRFSSYKDMITAADAQMYLKKQQHNALRA